MTTVLLTYGQILNATLVTTIGQIQAYVDGLLRAENSSVDESKQGGLPVWAIILIIGGVVICLIPLCAVVVIAILALMGPSVGNVFSNIILDL